DPGTASLRGATSLSDPSAVCSRAPQTRSVVSGCRSAVDSADPSPVKEARVAICRKWFLTALAALTLPGCAYTDVRLKPPTAGLKASIPGGNGRQVIVSVPFSDERQIKDRCGMQKGGWGNETATAFCQGEPAQWIAAFLASELTASGFTVLPAEA